jgi:protein-S-isoprenylcysteine O-methyltransferase Ste14
MLLNTPHENIGSKVDRLLLRPFVDRLIGIVAALPFGYAMWESLQERPLPIESLLLVCELAFLAFTMATRRVATRVTHNPAFWLLAFAATYWSFYAMHLYEAGEPLVPRWLSVLVACVGFAITMWARISLGRNIGFVPAERRIVTSGAYAFVRHPIYTGLFINIVAVDLASFSWMNVLLDVVWIAMWIVKSLVEERFLRDSTEYAEYLQRVRWRWFPGIA